LLFGLGWVLTVNVVLWLANAPKAHTVLRKGFEIAYVERQIIKIILKPAGRFGFSPGPSF